MAKKHVLPMLQSVSRSKKISEKGFSKKYKMTPSQARDAIKIVGTLCVLDETENKGEYSVSNIQNLKYFITWIKTCSRS